jgi:hypothetical protein
MKFLLTFLLVITFVGCGSQSIHKETTQFPVGKRLYISKCGGCHQLYGRNEFVPAQWDTILVSMRTKAKISSDEEREILNFLKER